MLAQLGGQVAGQMSVPQFVKFPPQGTMIYLVQTNVTGLYNQISNSLGQFS